MVNGLPGFTSKVLKRIMQEISARIVEYISSEEFKNMLKSLTKKAVEEIVKIIISEKKATMSKWRIRNRFCCKVFQKIYFSVKLRKKTESWDR